MSWSIGYDSKWKRDVGYGVPAWCDHPNCNEEIDRGLSHVCGGEPCGGEKGCGLYFCGKHLAGLETSQRCPKCSRYDHAPYKAKPDHPKWTKHKLTHESWQQWREENQDEVVKMKGGSQ